MVNSPLFCSRLSPLHQEVLPRWPKVSEMGRRSSDTEEESRSRRKKKHRRRSSSSSSSDSRSYSRKKSGRKSRSRSRSRDLQSWSHSYEKRCICRSFYKLGSFILWQEAGRVGILWHRLF
ncbi:hypothetical protein Nmel_011980 [Mimus melanotis]